MKVENFNRAFQRPSAPRGKAYGVAGARRKRRDKVLALAGVSLKSDELLAEVGLLVCLDLLLIFQDVPGENLNVPYCHISTANISFT